MKVAKLFVAFGIAVLLTVFLGNLFSTVYKAPKLECGMGSSSSCFSDYTSALSTYQIIYYIILALFGIISIVLGFFILQKESIGAGFILGGIFILLFANLFSIISIIMGSLLGGLSGLTGFAVSGGGTNAAMGYLSILFNFIGLVLLILFANFKLERESEVRTSEYFG